MREESALDDRHLGASDVVLDDVSPREWSS